MLRSRLAALMVLLFGAATSASAAEMEFPKNHWRQRSPESLGVDARQLQKAVDYLERHAGRDGVHELLIVRDGYILHAGDRIDKVHGVWSCTKSFTSTVLGLAIDDGKCDLDSRASRFVSDLKEHYGAVQLRHFTTMTSGYRAVGDEPQGGYAHGPSRTPFSPSKDPFA